ncbi:MAG: hypothetical protein ACI30W_01345 [Muribaculaceae bacterium]
MYYLGIDPGKNGALCVLDSHGDIVRLDKMAPTPTELRELFDRLQELQPLYCIIERVGGMPGQGGAAMFNFGYNYGQLIQCLTDYGIPHKEVVPAKWQTAEGCRGLKNESKTAHKNRIKDKAKRLYPKAKVTLATADAIMIARYALSLQV